MNKLTSLQSYNVLSHFLETYYDKTASDSLGCLLSDMQFLDDGTTADSAAWHDWIDALSVDKSVSIEEGFVAAINFLDAYFKRTSCASVHIKNLLDDMRLSHDKSTAWNNWVKSVNFADKKNYLELVK